MRQVTVTFKASELDAGTVDGVLQRVRALLAGGGGTDVRHGHVVTVRVEPVSYVQCQGCAF